MSPSGLLIFGTSHVGKSTMAGIIGDAADARVTSTDGLGRHPGRPWPDVRPQVDEYYSHLADETIYWFLRVHHENMWPLIRHKIDVERSSGRFVLEGSALRPELISTLGHADVLSVGLYADQDFLRERMERESRYVERDEHRKLLISKFITRSLRDNDQVVEDARRLRMRLVDVANPGRLQQIAEELAATLSPGAGRPRLK